MVKLKFGKHAKFSEDRFAARDKGREYYQRTYRGVPMEGPVHGTIGLYHIGGVLQTDKAITYRYQDGKQYKYKYNPPWPNGNPAAQNGRDAMIAGNIAWAALGAEEKAWWNEAGAKQQNPLPGRILFLGYYISLAA